MTGLAPSLNNECQREAMEAGSGTPVGVATPPFTLTPGDMPPGVFY